MKDLIAAIERNRVLLGITKRSLCASCDISAEYYHRIINGQATGVSYAILSELSSAVQISMRFELLPSILTDLMVIPKKKRV